MAAITQYNIYSYVKGVNGYGLPFSNTAFSATLAANTDTTLAVPLGAAAGAPAAVAFNKFIVQLKYSKDSGGAAGDVWVSVNGTAAVPAGATFASTTSILNPTAKTVKAGDVLHFISADTGVSVSAEFFAVQEG